MAAFLLPRSVLNGQCKPTIPNARHGEYPGHVRSSPISGHSPLENSGLTPCSFVALPPEAELQGESLLWSRITGVGQDRPITVD